MAAIPKGGVLTYKQVAELAGSPQAYRAVGNILNKNRNPEVPCHRVIRSDGRIGGFAWGEKCKKEILKSEGYLPIRASILSPDFFRRPALQVAQDLLGKHLVRRIGKKTYPLRITEVEAYDGPHDLACHAAKGRTARTEPMFAQGGLFYVYLCYGMHWMLNIVTGPADYPAAVLIRAAEESGSRPRNMDGPAKLTKYLRINKSLNKKPAHPSSGLWFEDRGDRVPRQKIKRSPRIGVDYAGPVWSKKPWRFTLVP